jgi:predicted DNA-binding transcriptional regulator AlpA
MTKTFPKFVSNHPPRVSVPPFPSTGFVRLSAIIAPNGPIPVSKSTWWQGVRDGRFPKPVKLGPKTTAWRVEDILALIARLNAGGAL